MVNHVSRPLIIDPRATAGVFSETTSGRETLASIEQSIADLRAREADLQGTLEAITGERSGIVEQRLAAYRELAEVRTRHALSDGVIDEADRLSHRVANLLIAREK